MNLFAGIPSASWDESNKSNAEVHDAGLANFSILRQAYDKAKEQNSEQNRLKIQGLNQDIQLNQVELDAIAHDQPVWAAWKAENNTPAKWANSTPPQLESKKYSAIEQQDRLMATQTLGYQTMARASEDFTKRLHMLSPEDASKVSQLPAAANGQPSIDQWNAVRGFELKTKDKERQDKLDDEKSLITAREKAREDYDVLRQQDRVEMANYNNVLKQDFMAAKGEQWDENWKRHKDYIFSLSRKKAGETFNDSVKLAGIRSELKRAENMPYKDQAAEIQRIESKYKYEGASEILNNSPDAATAPTSTAATNIPTVATQSEYDALPKGSKYKDSKGQTATKK